MKPCQLADKQITAAKAAMKKEWDKYADRLEVTNLDEGRKLCWQHVKNYFTKA